MGQEEKLMSAKGKKRYGTRYSGYQMFSASYVHRSAKFEAATITGTVVTIFRISIKQINNRRMERGGNPAKREGRRLVKGEIRKFFDREFDWIALLLITVIILLSLVFF